MQTTAQKIATALNVSEIDADRSTAHAAMRHAEAKRQAEVIEALADRANLDLDSLLATVNANAAA